jgi:signal transduction histidine kinase
MYTSWRKSIRKKLMVLFTVNTTAALAISCLTFWIYLTISYRSTLVHEEQATAQLLAESSTSALSFDDYKAGNETLSILRAEPRVAMACLYDKRGKPFAAYFRNSGSPDCPVSAGKTGFRFSMRFLKISYPVLVDHENIGDLYMQVSLEEMFGVLLRFGALGFTVLLAASVFAFLLSSRLQRVISNPILHLTGVASRVSSSANYAIRATMSSDDETGVLIDQFNSMMEQVHHRDLKLQKAQDELEARVEMRTSELRKEITEREVIQHDLLNAKLEAEESNRAKSAFLANMSHELRTPLNAILGYSEMLEEDAEANHDDSAVSDLRRIQSAGRLLLTLIGDILDLSKIEAGKIEIHTEQVSISTIIREIKPTIEPLARKKNNIFEVKADDLNALVSVDIFKFHQCLLNLLSNACKFTESGEITLNVVHHREESGAWILWEVHDTGIGIAETDQKKLFQSFSQVDSSATRRHGGTGLGLAISQRLTQLMGGWISVDSAPGRGSRFTIHLPDMVESYIDSPPATVA